MIEYILVLSRRELLGLNILTHIDLYNDLIRINCVVNVIGIDFFIKDENKF